MIPVEPARQRALLHALGMTVWRLRTAPSVAAEATVELNEHETVQPRYDLCLYADCHSAEESELVQRIAQAIHGLRAELSLSILPLETAAPHAQVHLRLDDGEYPSPRSMLRDPSRKAPLWQAIKQAVERLP